MGKKSADTFNAYSDAADKASVIKQDLQTMAGFANKMPSELGVIKGRMLNFTSPRTTDFRANQKLVLDMFSQMPHIGRSGNLLLNTIQQSKVPATMDIMITSKSKSFVCGSQLRYPEKPIQPIFNRKRCYE